MLPLLRDRLLAGQTPLRLLNILDGKGARVAFPRLAGIQVLRLDEALLPFVLRLLAPLPARRLVVTLPTAVVQIHAVVFLSTI